MLAGPPVLDPENNNITSIKEDNKYLLEVNVEVNLASTFDEKHAT